MRIIPTAAMQGFDAHVDCGSDTIERAARLCQEAARQFQLKMGCMHHKPVGPHPDWSCQLAFRAEVLGRLAP